MPFCFFKFLNERSITNVPKLSNMTYNPNIPLSGIAASIDRRGLLAIVWSAFLITTLFTFLRCFIRWRQNGRLFPDDIFIILAWLTLLTNSILQTQQMDALMYNVYLMAGRISLDDPNLVFYTEQLTRWEFPIITLFWTVLWLVKANFLAMFYQLVRPITFYRRLWYCVSVFTFLAYVGSVVASTMTCGNPRNYFIAGKSESQFPQS